MNTISEIVEAAVYKSTRPQLQAFMDGPIWADMLGELDVWSSRAQEEFDTCVGLRELGVLQGRREAIEYLKQLPEMLIQSLTDLIEAKKSGQKLTTQEDELEGLEDE